MAAPLLELQHLSIALGGASIVRDVTWTVKAGEAWAVLGPNGAGKSTLVRAVLGLIKPSAGQVRLQGLELVSLDTRAVAKIAAWVPQGTADDAEFSALEVALMGRAPFRASWGLPSAEELQHARAALEEMGLGSLADRPLHQLSGGERRRAYLARALLQQPSLLVLDEPTAFLDVRHQISALRAVKERVSKGLGAIAVLHDVNLATHFATHALLLRGGEVLAAGPCSDVLTTERLSALYEHPMQRAGDADAVWVPRWDPA